MSLALLQGQNRSVHHVFVNAMAVSVDNGDWASGKIFDLLRRACNSGQLQALIDDGISLNRQWNKQGVKLPSMLRPFGRRLLHHWPYLDQLV
jgi:hypothetical protein